MTPESIVLRSILMGVAGGLVRGLVGILKHYETAPPPQRIRWGYFSFSLLVAAAVGALAGAVIEGDWRFAAVAGYAGTDFIESVYKLGKARAGTA